jgi:aminoglycoside phosphotransferase (APT) family kinase protein
MKDIFLKIPELKNFIRTEKITYGWSFDEKHMIETSNGEKYLLRLAPAEKIENKKKEHEIVSVFNSLDFDMSRVVGSGLIGDRSYILYYWVEGQDLRSIISSLSESEQFEIGLKTGRILKGIHSLPVQKRHIPETNKIPKKKRQLKQYEASDVRIENDEEIIKYEKDNLHLMCATSPTYKHGDFHTGNLLYTPSGNVGVIDFQRSGCGDPFEEFYKLQHFDVSLSIPFAVGYLKGYFNGEPTEDFWRINSVYVAHASLYSIVWALPFGEKEVLGMREIALKNIDDFDGFTKIVPKWYRENSSRWGI